jgi:hypothetical protein
MDVQVDSAYHDFRIRGMYIFIMEICGTHLDPIGTPFNRIMATCFIACVMEIPGKIKSFYNDQFKV